MDQSLVESIIAYQHSAVDVITVDTIIDRSTHSTCLKQIGKWAFLYVVCLCGLLVTLIASALFFRSTIYSKKLKLT